MVLSPRLRVDEWIPLRSAKANPVIAYVLFGLLAVGIFIGAAVTDGVLYRWALVSVGVAIVLFQVYLHALLTAASPGDIRMRREGTLRFVPPPRLLVMPVLISVVAMVPGALAVLAGWFTEERFGVGQGSIWLTIMFGASVLWLLKQAWALREPTGLELSPWGLLGVRGSASVRIAWADLGNAAAVSSATGAKLQLSTADGTKLSINGAHLGSDVNLVAALIEHFRVHPEHRETLTDARAAVRSAESR